MTTLTRNFYYKWEYDLESDPATYWPLVSDTNRFNRDTGLPALNNLGKKDLGLKNARRKLRFSRLGIPVTWVEEPFEWERPHKFGVLRKYSTGPVAEMRVQTRLAPRARGGTHLTYEVWAKPRNLLGLLAIPAQIGLISAGAFKRAFLDYDRRIQQSEAFAPAVRARLAPGGGTRLVRLKEELVGLGVAGEIATRLVELVSKSDDFEAANLRPYAWADRWQADRKSVLEMFLIATRLGILDFSWHLLCPSCRVARETSDTLRQLPSKVHCDTCLIEYEINFDQSVELTFRPNPSIREVSIDLEYCIAGPQITPHIVAQQLLPANTRRTITPLFDDGRYRFRVLGRPGVQFFRVSVEGNSSIELSAPAVGDAREELILNQSSISLANNSSDEGLFILERVAWSDQAVTAAEVTALQKFRDLFASEALRPGDRFAVGRLAVVFTDLRQSTRMYRTIGDAPAFGQVSAH
ncbi:MAG: hypothetical protein HYU84_09700 [Chloroflexi bacterium]|nr:hypothetical protein [Chloroflexota bacterium]